MKKPLYVLLCLTLLLTGCGDAVEEEDALLSKYAYLTEFFDFQVEEAEQFQGVDLCCISGRYVFFSGSCITGSGLLTNAVTGEPILHAVTGEPVEGNYYETRLFRTDLDTRETVRMDYVPVELPEGMVGISSLNRMCAGMDGTLWLLESVNTYSYDLPEDFDSQTDRMENYYASGGNFLLLRQFDADGRLLKTVDVTGLAPANVDMHFDADGNIYLNSDTALYLLDARGVLLSKQMLAATGIVCQISDTEIGELEITRGTFRPLEPAARDFGKDVTVGFEAIGVYPGIADYQFLYEDISGNVFGYMEETGEPEKLFSWLECDVNRSGILSYKIMEDGDVAAITYEISNGTMHYGLLSMERVDPSELPQKLELTLACMRVSPDVSSAVTRFNQQNSGVQIVIKDYAAYNTAEDRYAGLTRLNTEILAGKIPDILCTDNLPVDQYGTMGIVMDLWPLIDSDESLSREDLMTHLFDVLSVDGKLYQAASSFMIRTAVGDANVLGDRTGWTMEEMLEEMEKMPDASLALGVSSTKTRVLEFCVRMNFEDYINWEDQTCSFDSPEFKEILNFANSFPAEFCGDASQTIQERFQSGEQLLQGTYIGSFDHMQENAVWVGGSTCYVGCPSSTGSGNAFDVSGGLAITSACRDVDAAWSFVRTLLTKEYQSGMNSFPTNRRAFDTYVARMKATGSGWSVNNPAEGMVFEFKPLSQEDYDTFLRLYESCDHVYTQNDSVLSIIEAEAAPFFDGQKTIDEVTALIQDRVSLYVQEQK